MPHLQPATPADIDEIMRLERLDGNERLVGRFERAEHEAEFAAAGTRYLAWRGEGGALLGFAILQRFDNPHKNVNLRRIVVAEPGAGLGRAFLPALVDWFFEQTDHNRLDLNVYVHNERAWRAYLREGFVEEGVQRDIGIGWDGRFHDMKLMSMLRRDWLALPRRR
ncbi:MAG TPA: GNAT family protein [Phenylobacterium sp.]